MSLHKCTQAGRNVKGTTRMEAHHTHVRLTPSKAVSKRIERKATECKNVQRLLSCNAAAV